MRTTFKQELVTLKIHGNVDMVINKTSRCLYCFNLALVVCFGTSVKLNTEFFFSIFH